MSTGLTFGIIALAVILGLLSGRNVKMDLQEWTVAGRNYGTLILWVLAAGEIYTTFTFLGASGYAYAKGGPVFYILGYGALAYIVSFFLLPPLWRYAKRHALITEGDYFAHRFGSRWLAGLVAVIGVAFMVPYTELQLIGLGQIVEKSTHGAVGRTPSMLVAFGLTAAFVYASGLRATAWTSVLKDALVLAAILIVGIWLPIKYFGGWSGTVAAVNHAKPNFLALPGGSKVLGVGWMTSTLVVTSLGFYMWPHAFAATYSARSSKTIRRNAMFLPFYQVMILLTFFVGFVALLVVPGLSGSQSNGALLVITDRALPDWVLGLVGGAGALAAMVPSSLLLLAAATLLSRNVWQGLFRPRASDASVLTLSRVLVIVITAVALYFAIARPSLLVNLLLVGYDGVTQFFPAIALSLGWRRLSTAGAASGIIVGVVLAMWLVIGGHDPLWGLNAGFVALVVNAVVTVLVSVVTQPATPRAPYPTEPATATAAVRNP